jgi:sterol desaturase/sphingolipid hydroxylase (fatty acid hydroxylase superfamily)
VSEYIKVVLFCGAIGGRLAQPPPRHKWIHHAQAPTAHNYSVLTSDISMVERSKPFAADQNPTKRETREPASKKREKKEKKPQRNLTRRDPALPKL